MNIAEFIGRIREQADRLEGFANEASEASDEQRTACYMFIDRELDMLQSRLDRTRDWLREQRGEVE